MIQHKSKRRYLQHMYVGTYVYVCIFLKLGIWIGKLNVNAGLEN